MRVSQRFIKEGDVASCNMRETTPIRKAGNVLRVREEFDRILDSIELMSDRKFMASYKKSREQVKQREFADWDEL